MVKLTPFPCSNNFERYKKMLDVMPVQTIYWELLLPETGGLTAAADSASVDALLHKMYRGTDFYYRSAADYLKRNNLELVGRCDGPGKHLLRAHTDDFAGILRC